MTEIFIDQSVIVDLNTNNLSQTPRMKRLRAEEIAINESSHDYVGEPDYAALAEGRVARREAESASSQISSKADLFIASNALDFPYGFEEPPPYFLDTKEWEVYEDRKGRIEKRREEALRGTF